MRVGVFGHVGNRNLGDEALIAAVVQNVRRHWPDAEIVAFSLRPEDTRERHGMPAFAIRRTTNRLLPTQRAGAPAVDGDAARGTGSRGRLRALLKRVPLLRAAVRGARWLARAATGVPAELAFLARAYRALRGTDLLLVAGSGQLTDYWGGPWGFPFTLFKWSLLARASRTRVAFLSVGAGPVRTRLGGFLLKQALQLADYHSYRDADSRQCIVGLGVRGEHPVVPDLVFSLGVDAVPRDVSAPPQRPRVVGINPMPVFDDIYFPESDPQTYGHYVRTLAAFADWLIERGHHVRFFATQLLVDPRVIAEIGALMQRSATTGRVESFDQLVSEIDAMDVVVATRFHGTLFALIRQKPVLSIAYQPKSRELMRQMGRAEYAIGIDELTLADLQDRFLALERRSAEFVAGVRQQLPKVRVALDAQYDRTFRLVEAAP